MTDENEYEKIETPEALAEAQRLIEDAILELRAVNSFVKNEILVGIAGKLDRIARNVRPSYAYFLIQNLPKEEGVPLYITFESGGGSAVQMQIMKVAQSEKKAKRKLFKLF